MKRRSICLFLIVTLFIYACSHKNQTTVTPTLVFDDNQTEITATPFQPDWGDAGTPEPTDEYQADLESDVQKLTLGIGSSVPSFFIERMQSGEGVEVVDDMESADIFLVQNDDCENPVSFVYTLVAPFPTVRDTVSLGVLHSAWGTPQEEFGSQPLLMSEETFKVFAKAWGETTADAVTIVEASLLIDAAWDHDQYAIIPFETLDARWKVIQLDGVSVLDAKLTNQELPITMQFCLKGPEEALQKTGQEMFRVNLPTSNRDVSKMTSVMLTGVTALVRATASRMEDKGINYPGEKIHDLLVNADFTHISNEVAFAANCPYPDPYQTSLQFCSSPAYVQLLDYLDIDIIELTGNHIQDWGKEPFVETLRLYDEKGYAYFGGGLTESEAREPLLIEHNGNKLAFLGCNAVGPAGAWATSSSSGNANCDDYAWIIQSVQALTDQGYLVIVTLQHNEFYALQTTGPQLRDFNPLAQAGAVIVSGSQAHYPNPFGFEGTHFIHYGLGNLFFDQMDAYIAAGIQREFVDKHYFYDGRYISTEVYTLYLEDFAQPRLMTQEERQLFLQEAFEASGW